MKILPLAATGTLALFLVAASASSAASPSSKFKAILTAGPAKQVLSNPAANGTFTATLTGTTLKWKLNFTKLTGPATAAHIHSAAKAAVIVPLCAPCKNGQTGTATLSAAAIHDFSARDLLYVDVHTTKNPDREIRGQLGQG